MKLKTIKISNRVEGYDQNWCERCEKSYCKDCVPFRKVEFGIVENIYENKRPDLKPFFKNYKEHEVCPWCYNQLVEIKLMELNKNNVG